MKNLKQTLLFFAVALLAFTSCDLGKQIQGIFNMKECTYNYNSVSKLTLSNVELSKSSNLLTLLPTLTQILTGNSSSIPMGLTVNVDVTNPNNSAAMLNSLQYILKIDDVQFATGAMDKSLNISSGGTQTMPLSFSVDLATLLSGSSGNAVQNIVKNFIGIGSQKSNVSLAIKPTFKIAGRDVVSPSYIPINFSFGGMKEVSTPSTSNSSSTKSTTNTSGRKSTAEPKSTESTTETSSKTSSKSAKK